MTGVARVLHTQQSHYLRKRVNFNDAGIATGVLVGTLPLGAMLISAVARVVTAFNAVTTNVLTVGTNSTAYDNIFAAADITEATPGGYVAPAVTALATSYAADTDVYAKYTQTGTAATTGAADILIEYAPNNDG